MGVGCRRLSVGWGIEYRPCTSRQPFPKGVNKTQSKVQESQQALLHIFEPHVRTGVMSTQGFVAKDTFSTQSVGYLRRIIQAYSIRISGERVMGSMGRMSLFLLSAFFAKHLKPCSLSLTAWTSSKPLQK